MGGEGQDVAFTGEKDLKLRLLNKSGTLLVKEGLEKFCPLLKEAVLFCFCFSIFGIEKRILLANAAPNWAMHECGV